MTVNCPHMCGFGMSPEIATTNLLVLLSTASWSDWHLASEIRVRPPTQPRDFFQAIADIELNVVVPPL